MARPGAAAPAKKSGSDGPSEAEAASAIDGLDALLNVAGVAPRSRIRAETHLKSGLAYAYGSDVANGVDGTEPRAASESLALERRQSGLQLGHVALPWSGLSDVNRTVRSVRDVRVATTAPRAPTAPRLLHSGTRRARGSACHR